MDKQNISTGDHMFETKIKIELSQQEIEPYLHQENYEDGTVKIEKTVLNWEVSKYECNSCDIIFTDKSSLERHVNDHHQHDWKEESVQDFGNTEQNKYKRDQSITEQNCQRIVCAKSRRRKKDLKTHVKEKLYKCKGIGCTESFKRKRELMIHMQVHSEEKPFKCRCNKSFKKEKYLAAHMLVHSDEKPFKCNQPLCAKSFKTKGNLINHIRRHNNNDKCKHPGCAKSFKSKGDLTTHVTLHSDYKPFVCTQSGCPLSFKRKHDLDVHMRLHSDERPYSCEQTGCTKSYKSKGDLIRHIRVHSGEKPYKCEQLGCSKSFRTKGLLNSHMFRHSDDKPFVCKQSGCTRSFKRKQDLKNHRKVHSDEISSKQEEEEFTVESKKYFKQEDGPQRVKSEDVPDGKYKCEELDESSVKYSQFEFINV